MKEFNPPGMAEYVEKQKKLVVLEKAKALKEGKERLEIETYIKLYSNRPEVLRKIYHENPDERFLLEYEYYVRSPECKTIREFVNKQLRDD